MDVSGKQDHRRPRPRLSARTALSAETLRWLSAGTEISVWTWLVEEDAVYLGAEAAPPGGGLGSGATLGDTLRGIEKADRAGVARRLRAAARSGRSGTLCFSAPDRTPGRLRHFCGTYFVTDAPHGRAIQVIVQDTTRARAAEHALCESEEFARSILEASTNAIEVLDLEGRLIFMNGPGLRIMEVDDFEAIRGTLFEAVWPEEPALAVRAALAAARAGETTRLTIYGPTAKGAPRWWDLSVSPILGPDGRPARLLALSRDITEAKRNEDEVLASERRLNEVLESTMDAVVSLDADWTITYCNGRAATAFPEIGGARGRDLRTVLSPAGAGPLLRRLEAAMGASGPVGFETQVGAERWFEVHASANGSGLIVFFRDVTERRVAQEQLRHLARHDALTGLPNRAEFQERLASALKGLRAGERLALFQLDLDEFKLVNDTLGHLAGDRLLCELARRLCAQSEPGDMVARVGGDEFTLIMPLAEPQAAANRAQAVLETVARPFEIDGQQVSLGASIGIAISSDDLEDAERMVQNADMALYRVKREKGGGFRFFESEMDRALRERRALKRDLSQALRRNEFALHYQPQIDLADNRLIGFEALLRWNHAELGPVSPEIFIPLAEESGMIGEIGDWVLAEACAEATRWPEDISIAVNLSPAQFRTREMEQAVAEALRASGLPPGRLELEITESVLLDESAGAISALEALHAIGVRVALDDFGTGYASLSYLRRFPFDKIKIDRSFVGDLPEAEGSAAIVRAIIGLGRSLKTKVTAEGIETWDQLLMLRAEGCDQGQGYLFSPPLPAREAFALLERLRAGDLARALPTFKAREASAR